MATSSIFREHLEKFIRVSDAEFDGIWKYFNTKRVAKKENILTEGQTCRHHYFVLTGLLRMFFINEKGVEQTTEFAIETWWITDNTAYEKQLPTPFFIQAVEKSEILYIDHESQEKLLHEFPVMERYFRFVYQRAYAAGQMRIRYIFGYSKEEFYFSLVELYPEFVQRVPQYLIASYLGFTPEYLSEIRKKGTS